MQVIPVDDRGQLHEAFNIRVEELKVKDVKFLAGFSRPTVGLLYEDTKNARHFKAYSVSAKDKVRPHIHADSYLLCMSSVSA